MTSPRTPQFRRRKAKIPIISRDSILAVLMILSPGVLPDSLAAEPPSSLTIRWTPNPSAPYNVAVEVAGLDRSALQKLRTANWNAERWQRLLAVFAEQGDLIADVTLPAMLGRYQVEASMLRFQPQFPLEHGVTYRAVLRPAQLPDPKSRPDDLVTATFRLPPRSSAATTTVTHVYPSADVLPENLLKFYVHFSAPMSRGHIYEHIHLRDEAGKEIELPFLEIDEELWNPAMTRLTLFIDPGRIKRGVRPLEEIGPALEEGKRYTLVIDSAWNDGSGNPLQQSFHKTFKVGAPDREPPDPKRWKIERPKPDTSEALAVMFPEPMDHALAQRMIRVMSERGENVAGDTEMRDHESRWRFTPRAPWRRGSYQLLIQTTIEDLAGNNIGKPFEVDLFEGVQRRVTHSTVRLSFEVQ